MQNDLERLGVGGEDDQVGEAAVEGLRGLVGSLLQLYHLTHESETEGARPVPSIVSLERVGSGSASGRGGMKAYQFLARGLVHQLRDLLAELVVGLGPCARLLHGLHHLGCLLSVSGLVYYY